MNPANHKNACATQPVSGDRPNSYEETLRLLAHIPVPEGLADRVQAGLRSAPPQARVLAWPASLRPGGSWMRVAAAAAIVAVVGGGGWGVYSRVQPPARAVTMPSHLSAPGGFSNAGAMRTPQTLNGPQVSAPKAAAVPTPPPADPTAKPAVPAPQKAIHHPKSATANKAAPQHVRPSVR